MGYPGITFKKMFILIGELAVVVTTFKDINITKHIVQFTNIMTILNIRTLADQVG